MFSQPIFVPSSLKLMGLDKEGENNNGTFLCLQLKSVSGLLLGWVNDIFQWDKASQCWKLHRTYFPSTCISKDLSVWELAWWIPRTSALHVSDGSCATIRNQIFLCLQHFSQCLILSLEYKTCSYCTYNLATRGLFSKQQKVLSSWVKRAVMQIPTSLWFLFFYP